MSDSRRSLGNVTRDWFRVGSKALTFGLAAAAGCFLGALIGEAFLWASSDSRPQTPAVCLLIDCSGSMLLDDTGEGKPKKLYEVKEAARQFVHRRHESGDRIAVVGFGTSVHPGTKLTADETELNRAIEDAVRRGRHRHGRRNSGRGPGIARERGQRQRRGAAKYPAVHRRAAGRPESDARGRTDLS